jgi:hypothetical protein
MHATAQSRVVALAHGFIQFVLLNSDDAVRLTGNGELSALCLSQNRSKSPAKVDLSRDRENTGKI